MNQGSKWRFLLSNIKNNFWQKERQESRGAPATLKGYMIKLNQLAWIIL